MTGPILRCPMCWTAGMRRSDVRGTQDRPGYAILRCIQCGHIEYQGVAEMPPRQVRPTQPERIR